MQNLKFLGKEWKFLNQEKDGNYITITEYVYEDFTLTIRHFFDPMFGEWWSCILGDYPSYSIEIVTGDRTTSSNALKALEEKTEVIRKLLCSSEKEQELK